MRRYGIDSKHAPRVRDILHTVHFPCTEKQTTLDYSRNPVLLSKDSHQQNAVSLNQLLFLPQHTDSLSSLALTP